MERTEIERILKENGFRQTVSAPRHVIDMQRSSDTGKFYSRTILYESEWRNLTPELLKELIDSKPGSEERFEVMKKIG